jgi:hypothetical protein
MTHDEASEIAGILLSADGFCSYCARKLFKIFNNKFPGFSDMLDRAWKENYSDSWKDEED